MSATPIPTPSARLFPLLIDDVYWVEESIRVVQALIQRSGITAEQIHHLSLLLFGLQKLPRATKGLAIQFSVSQRVDHEMQYCSINLSEDWITLDQGGTVYDEQIGSDSFGDKCFEVEIGRGRFADEYQVGQWLDLLQTFAAADETEINISNEGDCSIDWSDGPVETDWNDLEAANG